MKNLNRRNWLILIVIFAGMFLNSCQKNQDPVSPDYTFYISNELKFPVTTEEVKIKLLYAQINFPEISQFKYDIEVQKMITDGFGAMQLEVQYDIEVQKLTYKTKFQDKNIQASGLVYLPKTAGNYPVLCFQNGTNTLHSEAPSENSDTDMLFMLESIATMGFIVVIPDYIGFGASSNLPHPYLHAESSNQSILDMLRAVNEFSTEDKIVAKPTKDLYIFGYSQGGWATMQLQREIEINYSEEFNLIASSCAAGPYSLQYMNDYITSKSIYPMPYFLAYLLNAYSSIGLITDKLTDFFQDPYASKIPDLFDGLQSGGAINAALTTSMVDVLDPFGKIIPGLLTPEYRTQFADPAKFKEIKSAFIANSVTPWEISTPTRLYHGAEDELIPLSMSQRMLQDLKTAGTVDSKIQLTIIPGVDHTTAVIPVGVATIMWFLGLKK
jgi:pimeloyl-ACP methyl ester carboxylesterase